MRRWNGWGDDAVEAPVPPGLAVLVESLLGGGAPPRDLEFAAVVAMVPPSRLAPHRLVVADPAERVRHARGQSMPDLIGMRSGVDLAFPDGVAFPGSPAEVRELLAYASHTGAQLIPYGGGTSVVGHVNVIASETPVLTVDLSRLSALQSLDTRSNLATFGAGVSGTRLEAALRDRGYTLGHFPQSFEYSTLGGWIATRSKGQQSFHYGGIERLFAGGRVETPAGTLDLPALVASSAGPDLREVILGSEGRMGIITSATVRVSGLPESEEFEAYFFPDFEPAVDAVRAVVQARLPVSMLRLSDPTETALNVAMSGAETAQRATRFLRDHGIGDGRSMLLVGVTGATPSSVTLQHLAEVLAGFGGVAVPGAAYGSRWLASRFGAPYLRNSLWERGFAVDTVETSTDWTRLAETRKAIEKALREGLGDVGEVVFPFTHLSHIYPTGSSLYTTFLFRLAAEPAETLRRWRVLKDAVSRTLVACGATISHQHGVGLDHRPYLEAEKGPLGVGLIRRIAADLDPGGILNPGKLVS